MIKIVVAEDQPLILKDLCLKIEKCDPDMEIAGTATDGRAPMKKRRSSSRIFSLPISRCRF